MGGQLGSKSPNLQSPPNVAKATAEQIAMASMPNNVGLQSMANNGSSPQVMSSIQGKSSLKQTKKKLAAKFQVQLSTFQFF